MASWSLRERRQVEERGREETGLVQIALGSASSRRECPASVGHQRSVVTWGG